MGLLLILYKSNFNVYNSVFVFKATKARPAAGPVVRDCPQARL